MKSYKVVIGVLVLTEVFVLGMFVGRETKVCQLQASNERQLSPHEQQNGPTPAGAPAPWNEERYSL
ncbi:hypothetical protein [Pseudomonas oryziphila]|uniref:Uncharacterized protein n=1 Tax=Pseudomonas entomophila TaxID=312306 RepID=A0A3S8UK93_9PSED|nr:hypothetical protein [Pseudomonas oryziphila]AZL68825.1 hypothetical protein EJA05_14265 [Pseudomonas oryziphila]